MTPPREATRCQIQTRPIDILILGPHFCCRYGLLIGDRSRKMLALCVFDAIIELRLLCYNLYCLQMNAWIHAAFTTDYRRLQLNQIANIVWFYCGVRYTRSTKLHATPIERDIGRGEKSINQCLHFFSLGESSVKSGTDEWFSSELGANCENKEDNNPSSWKHGEHEIELSRNDLCAKLCLNLVRTQ